MISQDSQLGEPNRLLDDASLDAGLRGDLSATAKTNVGYDVSAGLQRFEQSVSSGAGADTAAAAAGTAGGIKLVGWMLAAVMVVGGGAALSMRDAPAPSPAHVDEDTLAGGALARAEAQASAPEPGADRAVVDEAKSLSREPVAEVAEDLTPTVEHGDVPTASDLPGGIGSRADATPRPASRGKTKKTTTTVEDDALAREIKELADARRSLGNNPARTLKLAESGAKEFPKGAYVQEREGYAILALVSLGRRSEAEKRGAKFLSRYPNGTMSARVRRALDEG